MSVPVLAGLGCPPQWHHVPAHVDTYGAEVADFFAAAGQDLDPEQRLVTDAMYAVDAQDRLVATVVGASAPRQNVKTHAGKAAALADLGLFRVPECLWTAHLRPTAYDAFRNKFGTGLADLFDNYDHLRRLVLDITDSDNDVSITLKPARAGQPTPSLSFVTRSERGGRGLSGLRVTFDEALFLKESMTSAMVPVLSAQSMSGQVQLRYLGSPGLLSSTVWRGVRDRGRTGTAKRLAWIEWAASRVRPQCGTERCQHAKGTAGCVLDREDLIRAGNLAIGRRMDIEFVMQTERDELTPEGFARERMGWWDDPVAGGGVLDLVAWGELAVGVRPMASPVLSVEVALDRSVSTLGAAWDIGGRPHLEVVEDHPGTGWVIGRVVELCERYAGRGVVVDAGTEAAGLVGGLEAAGLSVLVVNNAARVAACGGFYDAATTGALTHNGDPAISAAIAAARWKDSGDGARVFSRRRSAGDIAALYAVVLALHGLANPPVVDSDFYLM